MNVFIKYSSIYLSIYLSIQTIEIIETFQTIKTIQTKCKNVLCLKSLYFWVKLAH